MAIKELLELDEKPSESSSIAYYLGLCYTQLEQYEDALIYLEQVVTSDGDLIHIYQSRMILSYIYTITGRYKLAEFELESLLDAGYESAQVYAAYGFVSYETKQIDEAIDYLEKALGLDPDNANALNSLGYILAENGKKLNYALSLCKKAVERGPENSAYLDSLGWVYFKLGNTREARIYLRKALNFSSGNKNIAAHMKIAMQSEA